MSRGGNSLHNRDNLFKTNLSGRRPSRIPPEISFLPVGGFYHGGTADQDSSRKYCSYIERIPRMWRTSRFRRLSFSYPRLGTKKKKKENPWAVSRERNLPIIFNTLRHTSRKMVGRTLFQEESFVELEGRILTCGDAIRFSSLVSEMYYYYYYYLR